MIKMTRGILPALMILLLPGLLFAATPEESLKASFPELKYDSFIKSPVEGLYEVVAEGRIIYYSPACECIFLGEILTKDRRNLTQERDVELMAARLKKLDLNKAVKFGSGKNVVVEVTDVDCQYCRAAATFFKEVKNATKYVFFVSPSENPRSTDKVKYILCSQDRAKAYEDAMSGKLDDMKFSACESKEALEFYNVHMEAGRQAMVPGTPCFLINGKIVMGANLPEIKKLLED